MIQLYKYSFRSLSSLSSSTDSVLFDIDISNPQKHNGRNGAYVTPDNFYGNIMTKYKLSLTYSPNYRFELDQISLNNLINIKKLIFMDNKQNEIKDPFTLNTNDLGRVWPSFGCYGGGREVFLCFDSNSTVNLNQNYVFPVPGGLDFYHSDDDESIAFDYTKLIEGILGLYPQDERYLMETGRGQAKRIGKTLSTNVSYRNNWNITASIAFNDATPSTYVKCWLNMWNDDSTSLMREIFFSMSVEYIFSKIDMQTLKAQNELPKNLFYPLFEELKDLISKINGPNLKPIFKVKLIY